MSVRLTLAATLLGVSAIAAGVGTESVTIDAPGMPEPVRVEVLLPQAWSPGQPAHLMVFLHDGWGNQHSLRRKGLAEIAAGMMERGELPATVIASPRIRGTFASDSPRGAMETFLAEHLVPALERHFPGAGGAPESRSVWGISLGGYGALKLALRHPEVYGRVAALAPWVQPLSWDAYEPNRGLLSRWVLEPVFGSSREESRFEANDLYRIAAAAEPSLVPPLYVRTGSEDRWERGALELVRQLLEQGIAVDAASIPGARHDWSDWREATPGVLRFLAGEPASHAANGSGR
jgi:enterochelin esterase-like enzyme